MRKINTNYENNRLKIFEEELWFLVTILKENALGRDLQVEEFSASKNLRSQISGLPTEYYTAKIVYEDTSSL